MSHADFTEILLCVAMMGFGFGVFGMLALYRGLRRDYYALSQCFQEMIKFYHGEKYPNVINLQSKK
jgi:hypothetical protein